MISQWVKVESQDQPR